jgi:hypothetical protein
LEGECRPYQCTPGERYCYNSAVYECQPSGDDYAVTLECPSGYYCENSACVGQVCVPDEARCEGYEVKRCKLDGSGWKFERICRNGDSCVSGECQ